VRHATSGIIAAMRALCVAILLCSACAKKPAAKAPAAEPGTTERKAEPAAADAPAPAPGAAPAPAKSMLPAAGDPCSGGEHK
jgi:hypothetical protein